MIKPLRIDFSEENIGQYICAFLNSNGGLLETKIPDELDKTLIQLENELRVAIEPNCIFYSDFNSEKNIYSIEVPSVEDKPYGYKGAIFILTDDNKVEKASILTLRNMLKISSAKIERWERNHSIDLTLNELDVEEIRKTAEFCGESINSETEILSLLKSIDLSKNGKFTNATDVCLSKRPSERIPQVNVRIVSFKKEKSETFYNDIQNLSLPICKLIDECEKIILNHIKIPGYVFDEDGNRQNNYLFPRRAIHEALVNAVAHRDYSNYKGGILINIADDYLKIWNSGSLPIEVAKSLKSHKVNYVSIISNPDIAKFLFTRHKMERTGKGSHTIIYECKQMGVNVNWDQDPNQTGVTITFSRKESKNFIPDHLKKLIDILDGEMTRQEIQDLLEIRDSEHCRNHYIKPALEKKLISMTIPDKPTSRNQKYFLSYHGKNLKKLM